MRLANLMNDTSDLRDLHEKVQHVIDATGCEQDQAAIVLHDCEGDVNLAATKILERDVEEDEWKLQSKKKDKKKPVVQAPEGQRRLDGDRGHRERDNETRRPQNGTDRPSRGRGHDRGGRSDRGTARPRGDDSKPRIPREERNYDRNETSNGNDTSEQYSREAGAGRGRGSRGRFTDRGRGRGGRVRDGGPGRERPTVPLLKDGRTFRRTQPTSSGSGTEATESTDAFPNSIETWTNDGTPQPAPAAPLTVGNWSDVVNNDDHWSEEDFEAGKMETIVFTPSNKAGGSTDDRAQRQSTGQSTIQEQKTKPLNMASVVKQNNSRMSEGSKVNLNTQVSGQPPNQNRGAALLQSLQGPPPNLAAPVPVPPPTQLGQNFINQSFINKQSAADSIKSLVGISPAAGYAATAAGQLTGSGLDTRPGQGHQTSVDQQPRTQRLTQKRSTKIPESAVEMPTNDNISALGVQFGALGVQFGADPNSGIFGLPSQDVGYESSNHKADNIKVSSQQVASAVSDNLRPKMSNSPLRPASYGQDQTNSASHVASDLLKNMGHQGSDRSTSDRNVVTKNYGSKAGLDPSASSKPDLYSTTGQQSSANDHSYKSAYNQQGSVYGGGPGNYAGAAATTAYAPYGSGQGYGGSSAGGQGYGSSYGQKNLSSIQDKLDAASSHVSGQLVNSTVTTNVLKNSLSATGKGIQSAPQNVQPPLMNTPQYIMPSGMPSGMPYAFTPVYDPMGMQAGARDPTAFNPYPSTTDVKYSRPESQDVSAAVSSASQAPVSQAHQQFIGHFPPGYGFFYTPMPQAGLYQGPGGVFPPMPAASNAHGSAASGFPKPSGGYGSHSSYASAYDPSGLPAMDSYKNYGQGGGQGQMAKGGLGQSGGDMMGGQSGYGKSQPQLNKVRC